MMVQFMQEAHDYILVLCLAVISITYEKYECLVHGQQRLMRPKSLKIKHLALFFRLLSTMLLLIDVFFNWLTYW